MASEIIIKALDKEKDAFEMELPPRSQITSNTVMTGSPFHFKYGALALVEHSVKVLVDASNISVIITSAQDTKTTGGFGIMEDSIITQLPVKKTSDSFGNTKYVYQWKGCWKLINYITWTDNTQSLKFVFNVFPKWTGVDDVFVDEEESYYCSNTCLKKRKLDVTEFLLDDFLSDFEVVCENETIKAHRMILASRSPKLRAMFQNDMKETREGRLVVEGIKLEVLRELLCFMYTGKEDFQPIHLVDLFKAADEYLMTDLKEKCIELIIEEMCLENALDIYDAAVTHDCKRLYDVALKYLKINKMFIADGPEKLAELCQRYPELMYQLYEAQRYL